MSLSDSTAETKAFGNYLYSKKELEAWAAKVKKIAKDPEVKRLRIYFNNHYGAKAVANALQFKELVTGQLSEGEKSTMGRLAGNTRQEIL